MFSAAYDVLKVSQSCLHRSVLQNANKFSFLSQIFVNLSGVILEYYFEEGGGGGGGGGFSFLL